jgi:hypothetical protein
MRAGREAQVVEHLPGVVEHLPEERKGGEETGKEEKGKEEEERGRGRGRRKWLISQRVVELPGKKGC